MSNFFGKRGYLSIMKNRVTKFRMYLTIDQEEIFLNHMCQKGWKPVKIFLGGFFIFERCEPGKYIARVTSTIAPKGGKASKERREQITEILTDSGAEIVHETNIDASTRIYAIRPSSLGEFEINTDTDSLIADYRARRKYHILCSILSAQFFIMALMFGWSFYNDYYTTLYYNHININSSLTAAYMEFSCAVFLLVCFVALSIPIFQYSRRIKELRKKREIEE